MLLRSGAPRRAFLVATVAVSIVTLIFTVVLALGTIAWSTATADYTGVSSSPASPVANDAPVPSQG